MIERSTFWMRQNQNWWFLRCTISVCFGKTMLISYDSTIYIYIIFIKLMYNAKFKQFISEHSKIIREIELSSLILIGFRLIHSVDCQKKFWRFFADTLHGPLMVARASDRFRSRLKAEHTYLSTKMLPAYLNDSGEPDRTRTTYESTDLLGEAARATNVRRKYSIVYSVGVAVW